MEIQWNGTLILDQSWNWESVSKRQNWCHPSIHPSDWHWAILQRGMGKFRAGRDITPKYCCCNYSERTFYWVLTHTEYKCMPDFLIFIKKINYPVSFCVSIIHLFLLVSCIEHIEGCVSNIPKCANVHRALTLLQDTAYVEYIPYKIAKWC